MHARFLPAALAYVLVAAPAAAQPAPPDPAALELARVLLARDEGLYDDGDLGRFQARLENQLLASPGACNPFVPECRAAATQVARAFAPAYRQAERVRTERITAYLLADSLSPAEMARITQYVRGDEGRRFLDALAALRGGERTERRRRELQRSLERAEPGAFGAALARFRQQTRNIARPAPR